MEIFAYLDHIDVRFSFDADVRVTAVVGTLRDGQKLHSAGQREYIRSRFGLG
mgnify:CR=1 FL=1